jgi:dTDP-4-amino-4,6-dideoxygalactose transaminase
MEKIKMVDLNRQYQRIKSEIDAATQEVLDSTAFIQGPQIGQFANELTTFQGYYHPLLKPKK